MATKEAARNAQAMLQSDLQANFHALVPTPNHVSAFSPPLDSCPGPLMLEVDPLLTLDASGD
jgi:hypothetical protein